MLKTPGDFLDFRLMGSGHIYKLTQAECWNAASSPGTSSDPYESCRELWDVGVGLTTELDVVMQLDIKNISIIPHWLLIIASRVTNLRIRETLRG